MRIRELLVLAGRWPGRRQEKGMNVPATGERKVQMWIVSMVFAQLGQPTWTGRFICVSARRTTVRVSQVVSRSTGAWSVIRPESRAPVESLGCP